MTGEGGFTFQCSDLSFGCVRGGAMTVAGGFSLHCSDLSLDSVLGGQ